MLNNFIKIAWRNFLKSKVSTSVNLICLALGMTCCILILVYVTDELSFNRFNSNYGSIYRIDWTSNSSGEIQRSAGTPLSLANAIKDEIPQISETARLYQRSGAMEIKNQSLSSGVPKKFQEHGVYFSDNALFSIFTVPFLEGNAANALSVPNSVVITEEMAEKYFGTTQPIGQTLLYDTKTLLQVTGVVKKMPANSDLQFDFLVSFETVYSVEPPMIADFIKNDWTFNPAYTFCLINSPGDDLVPVLNELLYRHGNERNKQLNTLYLQPLKKIHLYASDVSGNPSTGNILYIYFFSSVALIILFIAAVNFVNLATAQASLRSREVGMRKVLGANERQLVLQFLGEALAITFMALILALTLSLFVLPFLNELANKQLGWQSLFSFKNMVLLLFVFGITGLMAGIYPAFFIARFNLVSALKSRSGEISRRNLLRKILLVTQFSISMLLIVCAIFVYQQLRYMRNQPLGFQKEHIISIPVFGSGSAGLGNDVDGKMRQRMNAFSNELLKLSRVKFVTASSALPGQLYIPGLVVPEGFSEKDNIFVPWLCVDYNFLSALSIPVLEGREFSKETGTDHLSAFIINESAVRSFGWKSNKSAIGKKIIRGDETNGKRGEIIGVVKDHHFTTLDQPMQPLIMDVNVSRFSFFAVNVQPDHLPETIEYIRGKWNEMFPERVFEYSFLDSDIDALYQDNENLSKIIGYFSFIAIFLSILGLFSLSSFLTTQRTKEIGIRKVLGAGVAKILLLLSLDFLKLVMIALIIATPIAYYSIHAWLQNYAFRIDIAWWVFLVAAVIVTALTALTVILQSSKAAMTNPVKSLRTE